MKSKFKKLMAAALVLCLVLALLPAAAFADGDGYSVTYYRKADTTTPIYGDDYLYGTITVTDSNESTGPFDANTDVTLTATSKANLRSELTYLSINGTEIDLPLTDNQYTFKITTHVAVVAEFSRVFDISTESVEGVANYGLSVQSSVKDKTITFTPEAAYGYEITGVSINYYPTPDNDGISVDFTEANGTYSFNMPAGNVKIIASVIKAEPPVNPTYTVGCEVVGGGGTIRVNDNQAFQQGDTVNVYVSADPGYQLASMRAFAYGDSGNILWNKDITATQSFEMPAFDVVVVATFEKVADTYTIDTNVTGEGTVTVSPTGPVTEDTMVTVTATPAEGYKLAALRYFVDGETWAPENVTSGVPFSMPGYNITVYAVFVPVSGEYAINVKTDDGCTVSQPVSAAYGDYVTIDIYMNAGHHLYNVYLDNELVTDDVYWYNGQWHYSFYMPNHDVDIYVTTTTKYFVNPVYNIDGGTVEVWVKDAGGWDSTIFADKGDWVCFKASPYSGYELGSVSVTGRWSNYSYDVHYNNYDGCYYFKMPGESVDLSVSFVDGQHRVYVKDVSNGSLTANVNWAAEGDKVYVTAKPSKGYELTWLSVKAADGTVLKIYEALGENTYYFYMPDQYVTVSGIFSLISSGLPFVDVNSGAWYYDAVSFVYNKGIMNGVTSTTFEPNSTITRGMVVTMLWRMAGEPYVSGGSFSDVASGRYYSTAVAWAAKNGIVDGYSSTVFGVNDPVTREQFATILYRYAKYMGYSTTGSSLTGYYDANSVSSWARDAMGWAVRNGIITGSGNSRLNPTGTASRAEVAQMFMSFYEFTT